MGDERTMDATVTAADGPADRRRSLIGRKLGAFTVVELIGAGGGGDVFRADQADLARSAVIKVMRAHARTSVKRVERFLREARLASRLDHPYAAHIYSFGAEPDDVLWIAMEHVRGSTLADLVERRGPVPLAVFAPFFERLCEVVRSAHELDIVHRDIKPSNVMVIERAGQLLPKLLDFGVAKGAIVDADDGRPSDPGITEQGTIVGTPAYMAPEQWTRPEAVDRRTDIYALGVLAYRCITGRDPFVGATREAIAAAHQTHDPEPLGVGPAALDDAIRRALAKDQDRRWTVATDFAAAVRKAIGADIAEPVPPLDATVREMWIAGGPQPFAETIATLADAATTVEADTAVGDVVDVACRWLAAIALARIGDGDAALREQAREIVGHADAATWLRLAKAAGTASATLTGLADVFAKLEPLEQLAERVSQPRRSRNASVLREDIALLGRALAVLTPLLEYRLVVGSERGPELWMGRRTAVRERVIVWWNEEIAPGEVVLLDITGRIALRLGPLVRAHRPLPHGDVELFLIASTGRGVARLAATPWGYELDDDDAGKLLDRLHGHDTSSGHTGDDDSPYPGLAAYGASDAKRFFGREHEVDALANRLIRAPRVAVLGPSGVGKSSFLHAGLAPRLADARVISMRPGREPFAALARVLDCAPTVDAINVAIRATAGHSPRGVVLIVDQLEELVTLADTDMRARFAELIGALGQIEHVRVVVALRDDFASMLESTDGLRERFEPFVIGAPAASALRRILAEPARRAGHTYEDGVVDDVVAEVEGRAGALPLLGFTAARLWQLRDPERRVLTRRAYNEIGGVGGAIATYADSVYASLGRREQEIARTLFGRLVAPDGTRVPVSRRDLDGLDGSRAVIERLVEARLLSTQETRDGGAEIVEPIHECLAERWPRLVRWRSEDAADRALIVDLRAASRRWEASERSRDQLWRGPLLEELRRLAAGPMLLASERAFAIASLAAERRSRTRRRAILVGAGIAITATAVVFAYLSHVADRAATAADRRLTESMIAHGRRELGEGHYDASLAYFGEALRRGADTRSLRLMIGLAAMPWRYQRMSYRGDLDQVTYANDASWVAAGGPTGQLRWWDSDGSNPQARDLGAEILWIAGSPDSHEILALVRGRAVIVDAAGRAADQSVAVPEDVKRARPGPGADEITLVRPTAFDIIGRDGRTRRSVAVPRGTARARTTYAGTEWLVGETEITHVDLTTGENRVIFPRPPTWTTHSDNRRAIAFLEDDGAVHVMTFQGAEQSVIRLPARPDDLVLSRDGTLVGVVANRAIHVFGADGTPRRVIELGTMSWRGFEIDGDDTWVGGEDGMLRHWHGERLVAAFVAHRASVDMVKRFDTSLVTSGADGSLIVWDPGAALIAIGDEVCPGPYAKRRTSYRYKLSLVRCSDEHGVLVGVAGHAVPIAKPLEITAAAASPSGRVAVAREQTVELYDAKGVRLASRALTKVTALVFTEEDTLMLADGRRLQRWTFSTDQLATVLDPATPAPISALGWAAQGVLVGDELGTLLRVANGAVTATRKFDREVRSVEPSRDGQYLVLKLLDGSNPILRAANLERVVDLPRGGDYDASPAFDPSGEFLLRAQDVGVNIFERATGELLVTLRELSGAVDDPTADADGVRVMIGGAPATFQLTPDARPVVQILRDIDCRVPLRVHGASLRDVPTVTCK